MPITETRNYIYSEMTGAEKRLYYNRCRECLHSLQKQNGHVRENDEMRMYREQTVHLCTPCAIFTHIRASEKSDELFKSLVNPGFLEREYAAGSHLGINYNRTQWEKISTCGAAHCVSDSRASNQANPFSECIKCIGNSHPELLNKTTAIEHLMLNGSVSLASDTMIQPYVEKRRALQMSRRAWNREFFMSDDMLPNAPSGQGAIICQKDDLLMCARAERLQNDPVLAELDPHMIPDLAQIVTGMLLQSVVPVCDNTGRRRDQDD